MWHRSERRYDPHPLRWEYQTGAKVLKAGRQGKLDAYGTHWKAAKTLVGQWVHLERVGERAFVYYYRTLIRELDLKSRASIMVRRWRPQSEPGAGTEETTS